VSAPKQGGIGTPKKGGIGAPNRGGISALAPLHESKKLAG